jgi:hypothetical protein
VIDHRVDLDDLDDLDDLAEVMTFVVSTATPEK